MLQHVSYSIYSAASNLANLVLRNLRETELKNKKISNKFHRFLFGRCLLLRQVILLLFR